MASNPRLIDMMNYKVGRITIIAKHGNNKRGGALWVCKCDCGNESINNGADIRQGRVTSCGCLSAERIGKLRLTHGATRGEKERLYSTWQNMKGRCFKVNNKNYKNYGGRGITVCSEWMDYILFREWAMSNGYNDDLTIERVDVNGNYEPANCTWIPPEEQSKNRNYNIRNKNGAVWSQIAKSNGIPVKTFHVRVNAGWTKEEAATHPYNKLRKPREKDNLGRYK